MKHELARSLALSATLAVLMVTPALADPSHATGPRTHSEGAEHANINSSRNPHGVNGTAVKIRHPHKLNTHANINSSKNPHGVNGVATNYGTSKSKHAHDR